MAIEKIDEKQMALVRRNTASLQLYLRLEAASDQAGMEPGEVVELVGTFRRQYGEPSKIVKDAAEDAIRKYVEFEEQNG